MHDQPYDDNGMPSAPLTPGLPVGKPVVHRVLLPGGETVYGFGVLALAAEDLLVPVLWFHRSIVCIMPQCCVIERWSRDELRRDWSLAWAPPPGADLDWLQSHPDWVAA
jgi:hypothetical protein